MKPDFCPVRGKLKFLEPKFAAVGAAVGSAITLLATNSMAQTLGTAVTDATTAINTDATSWIPGIFGIIALGTLVVVGIKWLGLTKKS